MSFSSWDEFENLLYNLSKQPGYKPKKGEKKESSPLISPATYTAGLTRSNANVESWGGWAALDVDNCAGNLDEFFIKYKQYHFVCYSTASSTKEKPKFRLAFPLTAEISADKIRHFWYALSKEFGEVADAQTKDFSRMYYVPAQYPNAYNFIFTNKGEHINPFELMTKHVLVEKSGSFMDNLPDHIKEELINHRKEQMVNRDARWTSYRDCPFVNQKLVKEYKCIAGIDGSGRYRMIYKIMTSIASLSVKNKYPISASEIAELIKELDQDTANIYQKRNLLIEAERAIEFAYKSCR